MTGQGTGIRFHGMSWDVGVVLRYRTVALLVMLVATVFFAIQAKNLEMSEDPLESMYPSGHPFLAALHAIGAMAPEPRMLIGILEVTTGDIYNRATIEKVDVITKGLMGIEGVLPNGITSLTKGFDHYNTTAEGLSIEPVLGRKWPETAEEFEALKRKVAVNPMGPGRYVSYDGTALMITASLADIDAQAERSYRDLSDAERARVSLAAYKARQSDAFNSYLLKSIDELTSKIDDANHRLHWMGPEVIRAQMTAMGTRDVSMAAAGMCLLILVVLAVHFRTVCGVAIPLGAMVVSVVWTLGIMGLTGIQLNPMALLYPLILGIFSLAYGALVMESYYRAKTATRDTSAAIAAAYGNMPVEASVRTAGLVAVTLCLSRVQMIRDLGYMGVFWLIGSIVVIVFMTPIALSLFPGESGKRLSGGVNESLARMWARPTLGRGKYVVSVVLALVLVAGLASASKLTVGDNVPGTSYIRSSHPWNRCFDLFTKKFMGPYQLLVHVKAHRQGGLLDPEAINAMADFNAYLKDECGARDSIAFDMMVTMARVMLMDGNPKWLVVPTSRKQIERLAGLVMEQGGVESFMDKTFTEATISPFFPEHDAAHLDGYVSKMQSYIETHPSDILEFSLGGGLLGMTKALNDGTGGAYTEILAATFVAVLVLGTLVTGSMILSLVVTLPLAVAQAAVWIIMYAAGMPLSMPHVPAAVVSVGFGSVFGYCLIRLMAWGSGEERETEGMTRTQRGSAGGPVVFLGMLVCAACLPWSFIGLKFQSTMVFMVGATVLAQTIASIPCVSLLEGWGKKSRRADSAPDDVQKR